LIGHLNYSVWKRGKYFRSCVFIHKEQKMNDPNKEQLAINTDRAKSIGVVQGTDSGHSGEPLPQTTPVARRKRRRLVSLIGLMLSGATAIVVYRMRSALEYNGRYIGIIAAFCAIALGGLLVRNLLRVMAEEDKLDEEQFDANQGTVSPPEPNPAELQTNLNTPPPEAGQKVNSESKSYDE